MICKEATMFTKVLVPLDGSELSGRALAPALEVAAKPGGEITLLRALVPQSVFARALEGADPHIEEWVAESQAAERIDAQKYLERLQKTNCRDDILVNISLMEDDALSSILDSAVEHDLIVMSTHGRSGLTKWVMGSVAEKVLASATCPVLVIRAATPIRRILIALDGSSFSESALAPGLELALRLNAHVTLLRIVDKVSSLERVELAGLGATELANKLQNGLVCEAENYLQSLLMPMGELTIERKVVVSNTAAFQIADFAQRNQIDVIVMATHGRTGLSKWVYGSVADKVVRGAACSMLVIRPTMHPLQ
jgi:nucleotide-binding universal stress UspA family protein